MFLSFLNFVDGETSSLWAFLPGLGFAGIYITECCQFTWIPPFPGGNSKGGATRVLVHSYDNERL